VRQQPICFISDILFNSVANITRDRFIMLLGNTHLNVIAVAVLPAKKYPSWRLQIDCMQDYERTMTSLSHQVKPKVPQVKFYNLKFL
jgi:hypothetical protein